MIDALTLLAGAALLLMGLLGLYSAVHGVTAYRRTGLRSFIWTTLWIEFNVVVGAVLAAGLAFGGEAFLAIQSTLVMAGVVVSALLIFPVTMLTNREMKAFPERWYRVRQMSLRDTILIRYPDLTDE